KPPDLKHTHIVQPKSGPYELLQDNPYTPLSSLPRISGSFPSSTAFPDGRLQVWSGCGCRSRYRGFENLIWWHNAHYLWPRYANPGMKPAPTRLCSGS